MHIHLFEAGRFAIEGGRAIHRGEPGFTITVDEVGEPQAVWDVAVPASGPPVLRAIRHSLWAFELAFDEPAEDAVLTYLADTRHQLYWTDERGTVHPQEVGPSDLTGFRTARWAVGGTRVASLRCEFPLRSPAIVCLRSVEVPAASDRGWVGRASQWMRGMAATPTPARPYTPRPAMYLDLTDDLLVTAEGSRAVVVSEGLRVDMVVDRPGPRGTQVIVPAFGDGATFLRLESEGMQSFALDFADPVSTVELEYATTLPHRLEWTYANESFIECEDVPAALLTGMRVARRDAGDVRIRRLRCVYENARADVALLKSLTVRPWANARGEGDVYIPWTLSPWRGAG